MQRFKRNQILIPFLLATLFYAFYSIQTQATTVYVEGQDFKTYCPNGLGIGFQNDVNKTVTLLVTNGLLNGTNCAITMGKDSGIFSFVALDDADLKITFSVSDVQVSGDQNNTDRPITSGEVITVKNGDHVTISWLELIQPLVPMMFIFGMVGLVGIFAGPVYVVKKFQKKEYREGAVTGLIIMAISFSFLIAWLW